MGERVVSLRTLLHRFSLYDNTFQTKSSATRGVYFVKTCTRNPNMYGFDPSGQYSANSLLTISTTAPFNFVPTHPITYVAMMYGGSRGSINFIANLGADLTPYIGDIRVARLTDSNFGTGKWGDDVDNFNTSDSTNNYAYNLNKLNHLYGATGTAGMAFTNSQTNGAISWVQPMLNQTNFNYNDPTYAQNGNPNDDSTSECSVLSVYLKQQTANTTTDIFTISTYAGTGPDYTCLWWLCCPTLDYTFTFTGAS